MKKYPFVLLMRLCLLVATYASPPSTLAESPVSTSHDPDNTPRNAPVILAHRWDQKTDITGWWMSEKFDGVRGYWTGTQLISLGGQK